MLHGGRIFVMLSAHADEGPLTLGCPRGASRAYDLAENTSSTSGSGERQIGRFMVHPPNRFLRDGDHLPFIDCGYFAVRFTEPRDNVVHQPQATVDLVDAAQCGELTKKYVRWTAPSDGPLSLGHP
ncbi:hypothetical protein B0H11DRAFT_2289352 [Mycena galericulata]|nr:hypothetical protein B0H11DRAFT_2289352 [Mycena galericulata]